MRVSAGEASPGEDQPSDHPGESPESLLGVVRALYLFPLCIGLAAIVLSAVFMVRPLDIGEAAVGGTFMAVGLALSIFGAWMRRRLGQRSIRAWYAHCIVGLMLMGLLGGIFVCGVYQSILERNLASGTGFGATMLAITQFLYAIHRRWSSAAMREWMESK